MLAITSNTNGFKGLIMRKSIIDNLCDKLNANRGLTYPSIGYVYFADIRGNGRSRRALWEIINIGGGVARSIINAPTYQQTAQNLRREIEKTGVTQ